MKFKHVLCWLRRDLRLDDHVALSEATRNAEHVTVAFVFDATILTRLKEQDDKRVNFIHKSLSEIDEELSKWGSRLVVLHGDPTIEIPKLAKSLSIDAVFTNRDYEPSAKERDKKVEQRLRTQNISFLDFKDQVVFERLEVKTATGQPYRVFTPYKNTWLSQLQPIHFQEHKVNPKKFTPKAELNPFLNLWSLERIGFVSSSLWLEPGSSGAREKLKKFQDHILSYHEQRDFPADEKGTSGLSVHLRFGTISIRQLVRFAKENASQGAHVWLSELIWRDFYHMILDQFPYVVNGAFKKECDAIVWPGRDDHFEAWKNGQTGFPLVDAAMRHFKETGWMHNRLRMVVASFLTKDLLVDWRKGEAWFAQKLLDFDLAANNGGWQWSASTGCDAQPYFRIFNPISQSERFDPEGDFIRKHVPELKSLSKKDVHWPHQGDLFSSSNKNGYPAPVVDHSLQRIKALALFKRL